MTTVWLVKPWENKMVGSNQSYKKKKSLEVTNPTGKKRSLKGFFFFHAIDGLYICSTFIAFIRISPSIVTTTSASASTGTLTFTIAVVASPFHLDFPFHLIVSDGGLCCIRVNDSRDESTSFGEIGSKSRDWGAVDGDDSGDWRVVEGWRGEKRAVTWSRERGVIAVAASPFHFASLDHWITGDSRLRCVIVGMNQPLLERSAASPWIEALPTMVRVAEGWRGEKKGFDLE